MMSSKLYFVLVVLLGLALSFFTANVFNPPVLAQSTYGSISGVISDSTGAVVEGAHVTLTSVDTGRKLEQDTGADGLYQFVNLFPGRYKVTVEKTGFKRIDQTDIVVQVQQTSRIDLTMQVGEVTQSVEVTGETPLLQTDTSSLGQVIERREANELPLNGRNVFNLAELAPSVIPQGNTLGSPVGKNPFDLGNFQVGGSFANQGAEYLDGQPLNIGYINLPLLVPTQDSIGEFKVQYSNLGPEWGKFSGGVINFSTKSGSNKWHGEAYEYLRARILNANDRFLKASEIESGEKNEAPPYTQNQFGGTVGGPIIKDRTFFFFSYEGYRQRAGTVFTTTVPTAQERTGNYGDICTAGFNSSGVCNNPAQQLYNPLAVDSSGNRLPIPNNNLSSGNNPVTGQPWINTTSAYILNRLIANPTGPGFINNFTAAASTGGNIDQYVGRADQNITNKQHLFGRFTYFKQLNLPQDPYKTGLCKDRCSEIINSRSIAVGWTYAMTPTFTSSVNASFSRFHYLRQPTNQDFDVTQEGWPASYNSIVPNAERTPMTPCFSLSDQNISCSQGQSAIQDWDTQWNLSPQFTKISGRHTLAFGFQYEATYDNYYQTNLGGGIVSFNGSWTAPVAGGQSSGGNDYADFLLGYGLGVGAAFGNQTTGVLRISQPTAGKQAYRGFYFGDTWKTTNKLTLNLGVRYELPGTWSERFDRLDYFDPNATSSSVSGCRGLLGSGCPGDVYYVKTGINTGRTALPLKKTTWSPRVGVAYSVNPKTVVRGGFGLFFIPNFVSFQTNANNDAVNQADTNFFASNNGGISPSATLNQNGCTLTLGAGGPLTNTFACTGQGPFGEGVSTVIAPPGRNAQPNVSTFFVKNSNPTTAGYTIYRAGYVEQWNLGIQRELPAGFFLEVAYAGAHGVHLQQYTSHIDQISDLILAQAAQQAAAGETVTIAQPYAGAYPFNFALPGQLGPGTVKNAQFDRPYPQFADLQLYGDPCCSSRYDSLQITAKKRFKGGGTLLLAYTNAKLLSNTDTLTSWLEGPTTGGIGNVQDWNNLKHEYSLSSQDVPQRMVINYVLDLPFGRGQKFMSDASGITEKVIGGWGFDGVTVFQRGFPLKITDNNPLLISALGAGVGTIRPDYISGCHKGGPRTSTDWFNTACYTDPAPYTFGTEGRTDPTLRQDGIINFDFAVFKRTYFGTENKYNLEFRTEFFNLFNRQQFAAPATAFGAKNFGVVSSIAGNPRLIQFGLKFAF